MIDDLTIKRLGEIAATAADEAGFELVNVEVTGTRRDSILRLFIDKEGGVTLDDCAAFSHRVEEVLDAEDLIPTRYVLEVSSPGIERQLYSEKDFARFAGRLAKVKLRSELEGRKTFTGTITSVDGENIDFHDEAAGSVKFRFADVSKANLKIELGKELGGR